MSLKNSNGVYVNIGSKMLKMAQIQGGIIRKAQVYPMPEGLNMQDLTDSVSLLSETFREAKKRGRIGKGKCVLCMDSASSIIRPMQLPYMNDDQIYENVLAEISDYLPVDSERFSIDYRVQDIVEIGETMQLKIMVVAIAKTRLLPIISALKDIGLKVTRVDVAENALEKLVKDAKTNGVVEDENYGFVNIGAKNISINMFYKDQYFINKVVKGGSSGIDTILADNTDDMDLLMAEQYKKETNFFTEYDADCRDEVIDYVDKWIFEINRVIDYYSNRNERARVEKLYFCGGGSNMDGLIKYFRGKFVVSIENVDGISEGKFAGRAKKAQVAYFTELIGSAFVEVGD